MPRFFFDTNILAYACDVDAPAKQRVAKMLIEQAGCRRHGCISTQVLQEFFVTATRKLHIEPLEAKNILDSFLNLNVCEISVADIQKAIDGQILWQLSFWDALIITAAAKLNCERIYTEDLNHGQVINGVRIINPFLEGTTV